MKKLIILIASVFGIVTNVFAQSPDSIKHVSEPLTEIQKDSVILSIKESTEYLAEKEYVKQKIGRYKVYRTTNTYNSLKLDTATGAITALQIGINKDSNRMEYTIAEDLITWEIIVGRFELYPTGNMYNFILLDTFSGQAWQVQWGTKNSECGRWRIW